LQIKILNMITTKINVKPHLAEYIINKYGKTETGRLVRFPERLDIYHFIWDLTERRPNVCPPDEGNLEIILPERSIGKSPVTYNYLSSKSQKIIERRIENIFLAEFHDYVLEQKNRLGRSYIESIFIFMKKYCLESISEDGLKKNCYRWLNNVRYRKKRSYGRKKN